MTDESKQASSSVDVEELRLAHQPETYLLPAGWVACRTCVHNWPCVVTRLLDALDRAQQEIAEGDTEIENYSAVIGNLRAALESCQQEIAELRAEVERLRAPGDPLMDAFARNEALANEIRRSAEERTAQLRSGHAQREP